DRSALARLLERHLRGVQGVSSQPGNRSGAIHGVADHRVSGIREVNANLMGTPRLEPHPEQRPPSPSVETLEVGDRTLALRCDRPLSRIFARPPYRLLE